MLKQLAHGFIPQFTSAVTSTSAIVGIPFWKPYSVPCCHGNRPGPPGRKPVVTITTSLSCVSLCQVIIWPPQLRSTQVSQEILGLNRPWNLLQVKKGKDTCATAATRASGNLHLALNVLGSSGSGPALWRHFRRPPRFRIDYCGCPVRSGPAPQARAKGGFESRKPRPSPVCDFRSAMASYPYGQVSV